MVSYLIYYGFYCLILYLLDVVQRVVGESSDSIIMLIILFFVTKASHRLVWNSVLNLNIPQMVYVVKLCVYVVKLCVYVVELCVNVGTYVLYCQGDIQLTVTTFKC